MKKLAIALALLLAGCDQKGVDNYTFEREQFVQTEMSLKVHLVPSLGELRRLKPDTPRLMAFAKVKDGVCEIYVVDSRVDYAPQWMGHELAHCIYGQWHPSQGSKK